MCLAMWASELVCVWRRLGRGRARVELRLADRGASINHLATAQSDRATPSLSLVCYINTLPGQASDHIDTRYSH